MIIVGWLILQGVGLADALWGAYMDGPQLIDSATMGVADNEYKKVAWDIFASAVCVNGYNKVAQELDNKGVLFDKPNFTLVLSFHLDLIKRLYYCFHALLYK